MNDVRNVLLSFLFPRRCPVCDDVVLPKGALICPPCERLLERLEAPLCMRCGREILSEDEELCEACRRHAFSFARGFVLYRYSDVTAASMARIKYKGRREYLDFYALRAAEFLREPVERLRVDALVPVPVHASRRRARGYNQAEVLAQLLGEALELPVYPHALKRRKKTKALKELSAGERLKSLMHAFYAGDVTDMLVHAESVLLIDDIFTTGATMEACTRVLKEAGVKQVYCFSLCARSYV